MKKIKGAEATVEIQEDKVVKKREPKKYRHPELDSKIREDRTKTEERLVKEARRRGVRTPKTQKVGEETLEIQKIEGLQLKQVLEDNISKMEDFGENIGHLHNADIIHGDLTTSNAMIGKDEELHIIDFGLSFRSDRIEDKAVDIHLLKQLLNSSHTDITEEAWKRFVEGYKVQEESEKVLEQLEEVESRGRYK